MSEPFRIVRHPSARRVRLAIDPASGIARLVVPKRSSLAKAVAWAEGKADWLAAERARLPVAQPFVDGARVPLGDDTLVIRHDPARPWAVVREGAALCVGGPAERLASRVTAWLKAEALRRLTAETEVFARRAGVNVTAVSVGDPKGRWGSCASHGAIRYSWRLVLAPDRVLVATVAHEVAHRVHMNHSAAFHALVADLLGADPMAERDWLRRHGAALHWVGRSS